MNSPHQLTVKSLKALLKNQPDEMKVEVLYRERVNCDKDTQYFIPSVVRYTEETIYLVCLQKSSYESVD